MGKSLRSGLTLKISWVVGSGEAGGFGLPPPSPPGWPPFPLPRAGLPLEVGCPGWLKPPPGLGLPPGLGGPLLESWGFRAPGGGKDVFPICGG